MTHQRLSPAQLASNRGLMIKAWLLTVLPPAELATILSSPMPPTITELTARARQCASKFALRCESCGEPMSLEPHHWSRKGKKTPAASKAFTPTTRARTREENS